MQLQAATQSIPSPSQKAPSRGPPRGFSGPQMPKPQIPILL